MLVEVLVRMVKKKDYYKVREITPKMRERHGSHHKWLTNGWVGRNLKKLGFHEKRRLAGGVEYFLTPVDVHMAAIAYYVPIPESDETSEVSSVSEGVSNKPKSSA